MGLLAGILVRPGQPGALVLFLFTRKDEARRILFRMIFWDNTAQLVVSSTAIAISIVSTFVIMPKFLSI
jgi:hypothetical protein